MELLHVRQNITGNITFCVGPQCHFCYGSFPFSMTLNIFFSRFPWLLQAWKSVIQTPWLFQGFHDWPHGPCHLLITYLIVFHFDFQKFARLSHPCILTSTPHRSLVDMPPNYYHDNEEIREEEPRTGVEVSTAEWKWVERLIPPLEPPPLPSHKSYPTPSGWSPPTGKST